MASIKHSNRGNAAPNNQTKHFRNLRKNAHAYHDDASRCVEKSAAKAGGKLQNAIKSITSVALPRAAELKREMRISADNAEMKATAAASNRQY